LVRIQYKYLSSEIYKKNILKKDSTVRYYNDKFYEIKDKKPIYALSMDIDESGQAILLVTMQEILEVYQM